MGLASAFEELGLVGFLSYGAARLSRRLPGVSWRRYRLIAVPRSAMPAMPRGHSGRVLDRSEIDANAAALDIPQAAITHRSKQGMTCLGVWRGDRLLGVNWVMAAPFIEDEVPVRFVPPAGCAWDTGLYLRPEERGGRAFAALWATTAAWLGEEGLDWSASRIADHNMASWRSHLRLGGRDLGSVMVAGLGGRSLIWGNGARGNTVELRLPS